MPWGEIANAAQLINVDDIEQFFGAIQLNALELYHLQVRAIFPLGAVDDLICSIYGTLDESSEEWDTEPLETKTISAVSNGQGAVSFKVTQAYKIRVGVKASGATDTITPVDMRFRSDQIAG